MKCILTTQNQGYIDKQAADRLLQDIEIYRQDILYKNEPSDFVIRICEAIIAHAAGYKDRMEWRHCQDVE